MEKDTRPIMVSICSITYNHAPYIRECLDGFLMQKTNFRFEVIINDDCSTDGTTEILREYEAKYPDIIKPIYHAENQYQKGERGMFAKFVYPKAQGKYVALCEGDDYWTAPEKLQKQVDFLEANPEYSMCFHNVNVITSNQMDKTIFNHLEQREYNGFEVYAKWTVPTCSILAKVQCVKKCPTDNRFNVGDNVIIMTCASQGKLYCLNEKWGAYRRHQEGWTAKNKNVDRFYKSLNHQDALIEHFPLFKDAFLDVKMRYYIRICKELLTTNPISSVKWCIKGMIEHPIHFLRQIKWFVYENR